MISPCIFSLEFYVILTDDGNIDILKVFKVDLICKENGPIHQTEKYDLMLSKPDQTNKLVIRRGQEFWIKIFFNRPYSKDTDGISFVFSIVGEFY